ncbi:c-type cytochrome [Phyllobacterium endophyticum]|uniref:Cytochrome C n=2 Tax=Phyllobacterium endophyticum TaxID=1149773 RepID=A0A2P7ARQ3_9HYPH|nr:cytochrome C [Phyllobacterium endophyticum]TYR39587.1 c-type cytochrome [Phyllobacterium endophyticum]
MMRAIMLLALLVAPASCQREERDLTGSVPEKPAAGIEQSVLHPGDGNNPAPARSKYEETAFDVAEGKRLFQWFNCSGCHFNGGGGIGPALMDDKWFYGSSIENIVATIKEGRPNGMPSFKGLVPEKEVWQLAAYVRSVGGFVAKDVAPSRNDDLNAAPAENRAPTPSPFNGKGP